MQQPLGSGFGRHTPASEVMEGVDLSGQRVVVTGGYSGIGFETTRVLAAAGAKVFVPARNLAKARPVMDLDGDIQVANMDLENHGSIQRFAMDVAEEGPLHLLINNAGIMACPERRVGPGWESQLATNHLGHMVLTQALLPTLLAGHTSETGFEDGRGVEARFFCIYGLAMEGGGSVLVSDCLNNSVRRVSPHGQVTTVAGNGKEGFADGVGNAARFYYPTGIIVDSQGLIYVADTGNHCILSLIHI